MLGTLIKRVDPMQTSNELHKLDLEATKCAKQFMGEFAIGTAYFGFALTILYVALPILVIVGAVPLIAAIVCMSLVTYGIYTVMHDAVHRSIQGGYRQYRWVNELLGYLAGQVLLIPFTAHRRNHLAHHAQTNKPESDPDFHYQAVGDSIFHLLYFSAQSGVSQITYYLLNFWDKADKQERARIIVEAVFAISWRVLLAMLGYWPEVLLMFVASAILGNAITVYFFAYVVHKPYKTIGRWIDTSTFVFRGRLGTFIDWMWLFQNYHSIHHLYPRVPFYRYRQLFDEIENIMISKGAPIEYRSVAPWQSNSPVISD